jgi:ribosomal silencing factor RsfS
MSSEAQDVHESGLVFDTSPDSCTTWVSLDMKQVLIHVQLGSH